MKATKKLIPALAMLIVAAVVMSTASYAWFSMNNKVTVTGMNVSTQVSNNLLIADDELGSTAKKGDANFKNSLVQPLSGILEPVSTTNGTTFFYTKNDNVAANGAVFNKEYIAYNPADTSEMDKFVKNSGATGAVGYVDYVFQLKAINTSSDDAQEIRLSGLNLVYGADTDTNKAYRIAMFVEDITTAAPAGGVGTLTTILTPSSAANQTAGEAVSAVGATSTVSYCANTTTAKIGVAAGETKYFKVVMRMWLEGEDTTCFNALFAKLTDEWALDMQFEFVKSDATSSPCVQNIALSTTATKADLSTPATVSGTAAYTINGQAYYAIDTVTLNGKTLYATATSALTNASKIFTIIEDKYPIEVTNQCILPA